MLAKHYIVLLSFLYLLSISLAAYNYPEKWQYKIQKLEVPVDHFSFANNKTFNIRYFINDTYWDKEEGPIFFYTGNEGKAELFTQHTGFLWETAPEFKALIVFSEHRYYGESMPFGNKSFSALEYSGYLSTQQVLADYADLITFLLNGKRRPVIAFGGSYGGMLTAYIRLKYPHLVTGSLAASAPVLQFPGLVPCDSFYNTIASSYSSESKACTRNIKKSWTVIRKLASDREGRERLSKTWSMCSEITKVDGVLSWLKNMYFYMAMINYPFECDFMKPLPAYPVREFCSHLPDDSMDDESLLQGMRKGLKMFFNHTGTEKCFDILEPFNSDLGGGGWAFQSCTEMVLPKCITEKNELFEPSPYDKEEERNKCKASWGVEPSYTMAEKEYGGKHLEAASNIVFSNGLLDPWSSGGVLKNISDSVEAILIPDGAHHVDFMAARDNDSPTIKWARNFHKAAIRKWIAEFKKNQ